LDVPKRVPNMGMILTMRGFKAGVDAQTMARLTSRADQYAAGPLNHVWSVGCLATRTRKYRRMMEMITTLGID
jgi:hypothetical protein